MSVKIAEWTFVDSARAIWCATFFIVIWTLALKTFTEKVFVV
jgi:hypothetical protein